MFQVPPDSLADHEFLALLTHFSIFHIVTPWHAFHLTIMTDTLQTLTAKHCSKPLNVLINSILTLFQKTGTIIIPNFQVKRWGTKILSKSHS